MAEANKTVELISKDGKRTWKTNNAVEITNLRAQGWQEKAAYEKSEAESEAPALADESAAVNPPANKAAAAKTK